MKRFFSKLLLALIVVAAMPFVISFKSDAAVPINSATFPDANFRAVILSSYDQNGNGILDDYEIATTLNIYCEGMGIRSVKGVEYFTALQGLWCKDNLIASMDLSNNKDLRGVWCSNNLFTSLDFSGNPELVWVYCYDCNLVSLNVSNNPRMAFIECNTNPLPVLDVSHNPELEHLMCGSCELYSLDVSHNPKLTHLDAFRNHLTTLDVTHNPKMKRLDIWDNMGLGSIDVSHCPELQYYNCAHNGVLAVDVSHNPELQKLICSYNYITALDLSHNPKLAYLDCACNQLAALDLSYNPDVFFLQAFTNNFAALNIGNNPFLIKTYTSGLVKAEYAVCRGHSWSIDHGGDLLYFLCFDDGVLLTTVPTTGVMPSFTDVHFDPAAAGDLITRETAVLFLYNMAGCPAVRGRSSYTDVVPGSVYEKAVIWAEKNDICVGYPYVSSDTFGVGIPITRQDLAFMLQRYSEYAGLKSAFDYGRTDDYIDYFDIDYYAWEGVTWAVTWEIMDGRGAPGSSKAEQFIDPHGAVTSAEFAYFVYRMIAVNGY